MCHLDVSFIPFRLLRVIANQHKKSVKIYREGTLNINFLPRVTLLADDD
jgi:hypothetical protein